MIIQYRKTFQGAHEFYALVGDYLHSKYYLGYTKAHALKLFKQEIKQLEGK